MSFFDQWLLRLILVSLLAAIPFLLYSVVIYYRPRAYTGRQKRRFWLALLSLFLFSLPLPRLLTLPQPVYQAVSILRLPSLQTPRLTGYQLEKAERDLNELMTMIYEYNHGESSGSVEYENVSYISRQITHRILDSVEMTLPWLRWLYPAGLLMLTAVLIYRNRKLVPGTNKSVPGTKTTTQLISEWLKVVNAWRDELGYYRSATIRVNGDQHHNALWNKLRRVVIVPDRRPMEQDLPDYWRTQEAISAPIAMALYDLQYSDFLLNGLYKLVRFITWFNPIWLWIGAAWRNDRQQLCQEALAARIRKKNGASDTVNNHKPAKRNRPRLAEAILPICMAVIAVVLLIQMPGLIVPAYQPLSKTQGKFISGAGEWQVEYQLVSDDLLMKQSMFASYQVSESYLNGDAALRYITAQKYLDHETESGDQNETRNLLVIEKRDPDNQLIWQLDLVDTFLETEKMIYPFILEHREMDDGASFVLCRVLGIFAEPDHNQEQHFTYYYVYQITADGQLIDYYRLDDESYTENRYSLLENGDLLQLKRLRLSETSDPYTSQYQVWLIRYNKQGQIVWQHHQQQLDRSENGNSGVTFYNRDPVVLVAADPQGGFYLVLQDQPAMISTHLRPHSSKFLRRLNGSVDEQIDPYSSSIYLQYSAFASPHITVFYQPARIIHYDRNGQPIDQIQLQQNQSTVFVPQQGFVTDQNVLILTGQAVEQELCGMLPSLQQYLQFVDQKRLQTADLEDSWSLLPAEQFSEAHIHAQIIAISPAYEEIWNMNFSGFSSSVLDYLIDSNGFTVLVEEPLPILDIENIKSGRFPGGPLYGSMFSSVFPYSSVYNTYLLSRQHLIRFDLNGQIEAWQTIDTDERVSPDGNAVVTAVFVENDRIICQMK